MIAVEFLKLDRDRPRLFLILKVPLMVADYNEADLIKNLFRSDPHPDKAKQLIMCRSDSRRVILSKIRRQRDKMSGR